VRSRLPLADWTAYALELARQLDLVAGLDDSLEAHVVDPREQRKTPTVLLLGEHGHRTGLGHCLHDQHAGHDRPSRKVPCEVPLIRTHALACDDVGAGLELDDLVEEQERISVRQNRLDPGAVEWGLDRRCAQSGPSVVPVDSLAPDVVVPRLRGRFGHDYVYVTVCPSTQRLLGPEHSEGAVAVAEEQTEGRGRLGRTWHSPPRVSILCSVLLTPPIEPARLPELSVVAGRACAEAIERVTGLEPGIKLPNDVLVDGRKAAGILAEARDGRVVVGIGVNVNVPSEELPPNLDPPATSLQAALGRSVDRAELLVTLLELLERRYDEWGANARLAESRSPRSRGQ
jgi:biotin-[acetyl-CoA-carboxylase] ligase BirA-like protein